MPKIDHSKVIDERIRVAIANMPYGARIRTNDSRRRTAITLADIADYLEELRAKLEYAASMDIKNEEELRQRRVEDRALGNILERALITRGR
jgi:hypothetical protein